MRSNEHRTMLLAALALVGCGSIVADGAGATEGAASAAEGSGGQGANGLGATGGQTFDGGPREDAQPSEAGCGGEGSDAGIDGGPCAHCGDFFEHPELSPCSVCAGKSKEYYDALFTCICADHCATECASSVCGSQQWTTPCEDCIKANCAGEAFGDCANDV